MGVRPQAAEHAFGEGTMIAAVMAAGDKGSQCSLVSLVSSNQ
jgi:hypothetical protein